MVAAVVASLLAAASLPAPPPGLGLLHDGTTSRAASLLPPLSLVLAQSADAGTAEDVSGTAGGTADTSGAPAEDAAPVEATGAATAPASAEAARAQDPASEPAPASAPEEEASPTADLPPDDPFPVAEAGPRPASEFKKYVPARVHYVWPFAKDHEMLPGDVRIPLPVWLLAVGGGASVAAGVPFYMLARNTQSRLIGGDREITSDAQRAEAIAFGRNMEAWGIGLWATGGALITASWVLFYVVGFQGEPKGLNYAFSVGPGGGSVSLSFALP